MQFYSKQILYLYIEKQGIAMVNFRVLSEYDFLNDNSDYAKSLRAIYGTDGYQKYTAKINSIIAEAKENNNSSNPMQKTNAARISYLEEALRQAVATNNKKRAEYRNYRSKLSGMIKISSNQQADLISKQIAYGKSDMNEDLLRSSLMDELNSQGMYYNA